MRPSVSVVVPSFNEAGNLADGSTDGTPVATLPWLRSPGVRYVRLSRNLGKEAALSAIDLQAAQSTSEQHSKNSSSGASVGIGFAMGGTQNGFTLDVSASKGRGRADGSDLTQVNTHVSGQQVDLQSGGDTNLKGAVIKADQVTGNIGGNLNVQSLQDKSSYAAKQESAGFSASICVPSFCAGASTVSVSVSQAKAQGDFQSVTEQSGIKAGDQGFQLDVKGGTTLTGAAITSTQAAIDANKNRLSTATLQTSDLANHDEHKATAIAVSASTSSDAHNRDGTPMLDKQGKPIKGGTSVALGIGQASGSQASTTQSAISAGVITITDDARQQALTGKDGAATLASLKRDAVTEKGTSGALIKTWDGAKLMTDVQAQAQITQSAMPRLANEIGSTMGTKANELYRQADQAQREGDTDKANQLVAEAKRYDEGGAYRITAHAALGALSGGTAGALGGVTAAAAAPTLNDLQASLQDKLVAAGMSEDGAKTLAKVGAGAGAALIGGVAGSTAGAVVGGNADFNNRQLHASERDRIAKLAKDKAAQVCKSGDTQCVNTETRFWTDTLEPVASGLVDDKANAENMAYLAQLAKASSDPNSEGARGGLQSYLEALKTAQGMLTPDMGKTITVNGKTQVNYGSAQTYFTATAAQKDDPYVNDASHRVRRIGQPLFRVRRGMAPSPRPATGRRGARSDVWSPDDNRSGLDIMAAPSARGPSPVTWIAHRGVPSHMRLDGPGATARRRAMDERIK
ncbi:MAG TPA: hemagglutinin repeat-containing protein, partial [Roseateles sp.]